MTWLLLDVASYQGALTVSDVVRAGFSGVNLKTSHGLGVKSVHPDVAGWIARARAAGLGICTFHWLDASAPGREQSAHAFARLTALGLTAGAGHVVDCEDTATEEILRDYVYDMQARLGRSIAVYSADWWWESRDWNGDQLSPYLWGAPNAGYLGAYPGDDSPHWRAGWGGWSDFAVMQYAVSTLTFPDGTAGTIKVSKSAVRDPAVWAVLTGGGGMAGELVPAGVALRAEFNAIAPGRDKSSDGWVGDAAHQGSVSDHNWDETGNTGGVEDPDSVNEVHAIDVDVTGPWPTGFTMEKAVQFLIAEAKAGREKRFRYIIFNKRIWSASTGWAQKTYSGSNPHDKHAHFSFVYGSGAGHPEQDTRTYGLRTLIPQEGNVATLDNTDKAWLTSPAYTKAIADAASAATIKALLATRFDPGHPINPDRTITSWLMDIQNLRDALVHKLDDPAVQNRPLPGSGFDVLVQTAQQSVAALTALATQIADMQRAEVERDTAVLASLLSALDEVRQGPIDEDTLRSVLRQVYGEAFDRVEAERPEAR